jgi:hypothetical protein
MDAVDDRRASDTKASKLVEMAGYIGLINDKDYDCISQKCIYVYAKVGRLDTI